MIKEPSGSFLFAIKSSRLGLLIGFHNKATVKVFSDLYDFLKGKINLVIEKSTELAFVNASIL